LIRPSNKPNGSGSRSASPASNLTSSSSGGLNNNNVNSSSNNVNSSGINSSTNNSSTSSSASPSVASATSVASVKGFKKSRLDTLDEVISSVIEHSVQKEDHHHGSSVSMEGKPPVELKHFVRRYNWAQKGREPLPIRIMTLTESKILYPDVPHSWLCDGKLLRLNDPNCESNYRIFQVGNGFCVSI
jgi:lysine-specific demethylase 3